MDFDSLASQLKGLIDELCKDGAMGSSTWSDCLSKAVDLCSDLPDSTELSTLLVGDQSNLLSDLESSAVNLWNFSVAMKTKGNLVFDTNAKLRHIAFFALHVTSCYGHTETGLKRRIMMGLKTSRAWLDCAKPLAADMVLKITLECSSELKAILEQRPQHSGSSAEANERQKLDLEQDVFTLLCYRAEGFVAQSFPEEALKMILLAKEMLPKLPKQAAFLSMLCYNLGVELYQKKLLQEAVIWLRESFELGKGNQVIGPKNQARTLRLLANVYLDLDPVDNLQKARNAVGLANTEHTHPAGLFLSLKILLLSGEQDSSVKTALEDLFKLPDLTIDLSLHVLQEVNSHKRLRIVTWAIEELLKTFNNSPDIGKLLITNLEVLQQGELLTEAKEFVEYCITAHHTGKPLDFSIKKQFHVLLWEQASLAFEAGDYGEALQWYNYSLSFYTKTEPGDLNLAKLHRNRANCYISIDEIDKAREAIREAEKCDPCCVKTCFISYRLALMEGNNDKAGEALRQLCECVQTAGTADEDGMQDLNPCEIVAMAAQHALESDKLETAVVALEYLSNNSTDVQQVFTALRCLVRMKLAAADGESSDRAEAFMCISYIKIAIKKLLALKSETDTLIPQETIINEASWFRKVAWNLALQCEDRPETMKEFFCLCSQLMCLCPCDEQMRSKQVTCLLMSAAACLHVARNSMDIDQQNILLEESLEHLSACRKIHTQIKEQSIGAGKGRDTDVLMLLYEFEARVKLKDSGVENVLEKALTLPNPDPKTFETLAAIALEFPAHNKGVCVRALKVAIRRQLQCPQPDISRCSKLFHSLIQLCLSGTSSQDLAGKEEAWHYYMEVFDVLEKFSADQYPEMETVWLMSKAWNCGINFYSTGRFSDAEKWCGMSMRMLKYLHAFRNSYEDHMNTIYADILAKVAGSRTGQNLEL